MIQLASLIASTRPQRTARRVLIAACSILGLGVLGSVAASAIDGPTPQTKFVAAETSSIAAMASTDSAPVDGGVELIHTARPTLRNPHVVWMNVTAYCPCKICCGSHAHGITASGKPVSADGGRFVAAPAPYPFGTKLVIPGYNNGQPVQVLDRGGAIKGNHLDVFFPTHEQAKQWGRRWIAVTIAD
jgi:3D (Asp-Asp-Asp) domain-containing protein